jgi:RNA polymerase sigma-70 factor (ECF subfamily)
LTAPSVREDQLVTKPLRSQAEAAALGGIAPRLEFEELLSRAGHGDAQARHELLDRHRSRLWRMVAIRLDRRVAARVDASDIVQEALIEAAGRLPDYLRDPPLPLYPWLRQIAWQHLVKCHQRHIGAQRRSVAREERADLGLTDESAAQLADYLGADDTSPSGRLIRAEDCQRMRAALDLLPPRDREVLVLRHLEQLSPSEISAVLGLSPGAVMTRHTRALERIRRLLAIGPGEDAR